MGWAEALDAHLVAAAIECALAHLREEHETAGDRRAALERELALMDAKQQRLVEAITQGEALRPSSPP